MKHDLTETRRRFMAHFTSIGLGTTLVPGILWARMQDAGAQKVTLAMVTDALKLSGLELNEADRTAMVTAANTSLSNYEKLHDLKIPNDVSPPFYFNPIVPGMEVNKARQPFRMSAAPVVKRPANLEEVAFWPVRHLAELVRSKQVTSVELTQMYLARLHRYNEKLNNTVTFLDDLAMAQAKQADAEIGANKYKGPLHGIPWGAKDIISVKGYKTTWGSGAYKDQVFDYDASVVEMLHEGGAVLIAKLTSGELAQGANWFGGMTRNPWNYGSSSGSSAGPGSATSAGCVGFAIGTETQGSILSPSATNGLAGLRPTFGRVSRYGAMTLGWTYDRLGPMCRYAEDCAMVMSVIAKPDGRDMSLSDIPFNWNPARYDIKKLKIGVTGLNSPNINPNAQKLMDALKQLGATLTPLTIPPDNLPQFNEGFTYEQGAFFDELVRSGGVAKMTNPGRGSGFKSARLMNVVDFLQQSRLRMMMMMNLAKATAGFDAYFSAAGGGGQRGGARGAGGRGAEPVPTAADAAPRGGGGGGGGGGAAGGGTGNTNSAGYPGVHVVTSFSEPSTEAPVGTPQGVTIYGPPFKETEILFIAKSFQDVAQLHTKKPVLKT